MPKFFVTYETVTPESAEHGDAESLGFAMPGGWKHDSSEGCELTLREACEAAGQFSGFECSDSRAQPGCWFTGSSDSDYRTGAETRYSIHPPRAITAASMGRLARLLTR